MLIFIMDVRCSIITELLLCLLLAPAVPIAVRMESLPSVSFSAEVDWCESEWKCTTDGDSDFEYVESTSEAASSGDKDDTEELEALLGTAYTSSPEKESLDPAERQSLLLFDKDFAEEEDLEAGTLLFSVFAFSRIL